VILRADEMGAAVIKEAMARVPGLEAAEIEDVIMGCAMPEAEQGMNIARSAAIRAGLPVETSAHDHQSLLLFRAAIDCHRGRSNSHGQCAGGTRGGLESMSMIPMGGHIIRPTHTWSNTIPTFI